MVCGVWVEGWRIEWKEAEQLNGNLDDLRVRGLEFRGRF